VAQKIEYAMATPIKNMFNEVQYELVKIILLNVFLSTVILFLIADLIALMFGMPIWYVIVIAFLYFIIMMIVEVRKISVYHVERKNPELKEILRTAKDNMSEDTLMAHALFYEVLEKMKKVSSGTFLDFKKLMLKLSAIFVLAIVLVALAFLNVNIQRFDNPFEKPLQVLGGFFGQVTGNDVDASGIENADDDVFGDPSMAKLGNDQLTATVNPSLDNPDFNNVDPANPTNDPLADLGGEGQAGFNTQTDAYSQSGLSQKDQERSYNYAKNTQGTT
jgi:type IV secretory pathway TrbD component